MAYGRGLMAEDGRWKAKKSWRVARKTPAAKRREKNRGGGRVMSGGLQARLLTLDSRLSRLFLCEFCAFLWLWKYFAIMRDKMRRVASELY